MVDLAAILRAENQERGMRALADMGLDDAGTQRRAMVQQLAQQLMQQGDLEGARMLAEAADMDQSMIPTVDPSQLLGGRLAPQLGQVRDAVAQFVQQDKPFLGLGFDPSESDLTDVQRQVDMLVAEAVRLGADADVARALVVNQIYPLLRQGAETGFFSRGDMTAKLAQALGLSQVQDKQGWMPTMGEIGTIAALASLIPFGGGSVLGAGSLAGRGLMALRSLFGGAGRAAATAAPAAAPASAAALVPPVAQQSVKTAAMPFAANMGAQAAGGAAMSGGMGLAAKAMGGADDAARAASPAWASLSSADELASMRMPSFGPSSRGLPITGPSNPLDDMMPRTYGTVGGNPFDDGLDEIMAMSPPSQEEIMRQLIAAEVKGARAPANDMMVESFLTQFVR